MKFTGKNASYEIGGLARSRAWGCRIYVVADMSADGSEVLLTRLGQTNRGDFLPSPAVGRQVVALSKSRPRHFGQFQPVSIKEA